MNAATVLPTAKLRVLLADDHPVMREGLKILVNGQPDMVVVGEAGDGQTACSLACELRPDVAVMDISLPVLNGREATARIKEHCPQVVVLAMSVHEDKVYLREMLAAGASGYVLKRAAAAELLQAVRTVAGGGVYLDPHFGDTLVESIVGKQPLRGEIEGSELSEREAEVLRLIARGYSNKEIGAQLGISAKTVDTYRARSMEKLGLSSRADIVTYALEHGWLKAM